MADASMPATAGWGPGDLCIHPRARQTQEGRHRISDGTSWVARPGRSAVSRKHTERSP